MFGNPIGSFHSDVLSAQPTDEDGKNRLVEEIKNRAKGSINTKNYPEAIQLYSKAIEIKSSDAILYSNRSMCYLSMGKNSEALADAELSIQQDATYAKAYFRKGSALLALKNFYLAKEAFEEGLKLAPGDKSFLSQLQKLQEVSASSSSSSSSSSSTPPASVSTSTEIRSQTNTSKKSSSSSEIVHETDETSKFRGYKKTSDGRTTTFFHNELDAETKALIGDIAPKKIDPSVAQVETPSSGESVWNKAGTWEERVHTPWALSRLKELLESIRLPISDATCGEGSLYLKNITLSGDAQVTMARGKVKHIYDFSGTADWVLEVSSSDDANGSFIFEDITGDQEYEIQVTTGNTGDVNTARLVNQYVKNQSGLQSVIKSAFQQFHDEFQQK